MYYVPDGTKECGFYECKKCGNRFLSLQTMKRIPCPECEAEIDYEIGPDESMENVFGLFFDEFVVSSHSAHLYNIRSIS